MIEEVHAVATVLDKLPNYMFRLKLDSGEISIGYASSKMRFQRFKIFRGDKVQIVGYAPLKKSRIIGKL